MKPILYGPLAMLCVICLKAVGIETALGMFDLYLAVGALILLLDIAVTLKDMESRFKK